MASVHCTMWHLLSTINKMLNVSLASTLRAQISTSSIQKSPKLINFDGSVLNVSTVRFSILHLKLAVRLSKKKADRARVVQTSKNSAVGIRKRFCQFWDSERCFSLDYPLQRWTRVRDGARRFFGDRSASQPAGRCLVVVVQIFKILPTR